MSKAKKKAHNALLNAIAAKAKAAGTDELGTLATAFQQVVHGPQGGDMHYGSAQTYDYTAHNHAYAHDPSRNGVGFQDGHSRY